MKEKPVLKRIMPALYAIGAGLFIGFSSAGVAKGSSPEDTLNRYFSAVVNGDCITAYRTVASADVAKRSLNEFCDEMAAQRSLLITESYEILSVSYPSENEAVASVSHTLVASAMTNLWLELSGKAAQSNPARKLAVVDDTRMIKENGEWFVFLDYQRDEELKARREKIEELMGEAREMRRDDRFAQAIELYSEVLAEDESNSEAITNLREAQEELAEHEEKLAYSANVRIYDFEAKRIDRWADNAVPAVRFTIKNEGNRTLERVEATVYFEDANGQTIFEKTYSPVLPGSDTLLKPNYIVGVPADRDKHYFIEELGHEWKEGAAYAVITDLEFAFTAAEEQRRRAQELKNEQRRQELEKAEQAAAERIRAQELAEEQRREEIEKARTEESQRKNRAIREFSNLIPKIRDKISEYWQITTSDSKIKAVVLVKVGPDGTVASAEITQSSGFEPFDRSVLNAIHKASPLPFPKDPIVYEYVQEFQLSFTNPSS